MRRLALAGPVTLGSGRTGTLGERRSAVLYAVLFVSTASAPATGSLASRASLLLYAVAGRVVAVLLGASGLPLLRRPLGLLWRSGSWGLALRGGPWGLVRLVRPLRLLRLWLMRPAGRCRPLLRGRNVSLALRCSREVSSGLLRLPWIGASHLRSRGRRGWPGGRRSHDGRGLGRLLRLSIEQPEPKGQVVLRAVLEPRCAGSRLGSLDDRGRRRRYARRSRRCRAGTRGRIGLYGCGLGRRRWRLLEICLRPWNLGGCGSLRLCCSGSPPTARGASPSGLALLGWFVALGVRGGLLRGRGRGLGGDGALVCRHVCRLDCLVRLTAGLLDCCRPATPRALGCCLLCFWGLFLVRHEVSYSRNVLVRVAATGGSIRFRPEGVRCSEPPVWGRLARFARRSLCGGPCAAKAVHPGRQPQESH